MIPQDSRVVREIDVASVIRVTFTLWLSLSAVVIVGFSALYLVGLVSGGLGGIEGFLASFGFSGIWTSPLAFIPVLIIAAFFGAALTAAAAGVTALLYNALTPLVGGIEVSSRDRRSRSGSITPPGL